MSKRDELKQTITDLINNNGNCANELYTTGIYGNHKLTMMNTIYYKDTDKMHAYEKNVRTKKVLDKLIKKRDKITGTYFFRTIYNSVIRIDIYNNEYMVAKFITLYKDKTNFSTDAQFYTFDDNCSPAMAVERMQNCKKNTMITNVAELYNFCDELIDVEEITTLTFTDFSYTVERDDVKLTFKVNGNEITPDTFMTELDGEVITTTAFDKITDVDFDIEYNTTNNFVKITPRANYRNYITDGELEEDVENKYSCSAFHSNCDECAVEGYGEATLDLVNFKKVAREMYNNIFVPTYITTEATATTETAPVEASTPATEATTEAPATTEEVEVPAEATTESTTADTTETTENTTTENINKEGEIKTMAMATDEKKNLIYDENTDYKLNDEELNRVIYYTTWETNSKKVLKSKTMAEIKEELSEMVENDNTSKIIVDTKYDITTNERTHLRAKKSILEMKTSPCVDLRYILFPDHHNACDSNDDTVIFKVFTEFHPRAKYYTAYVATYRYDRCLLSWDSNHVYAEMYDRFNNLTELDNYILNIHYSCMRKMADNSLDFLMRTFMMGDYYNVIYYPNGNNHNVDYSVYNCGKLVSSGECELNYAGKDGEFCGNIKLFDYNYIAINYQDKLGYNYYTNFNYRFEYCIIKTEAPAPVETEAVEAPVETAPVEAPAPAETALTDHELILMVMKQVGELSTAVATLTTAVAELTTTVNALLSSNGGAEVAPALDFEGGDELPAGAEELPEEGGPDGGCYETDLIDVEESEAMETALATECSTESTTEEVAPVETAPVEAPATTVDSVMQSRYTTMLNIINNNASANCYNYYTASYTTPNIFTMSPVINSNTVDVMLNEKSNSERITSNYYNVNDNRSYVLNLYRIKNTFNVYIEKITFDFYDNSTNCYIIQDNYRLTNTTGEECYEFITKMYPYNCAVPTDDLVEAMRNAIE